jgi:ABC-type transport system involved in multi-copper enzyme maturation permease subunit
MTLVLAGIRKFKTRIATLVSLLVAVALVVIEFVIVGAAYRAAPNDPNNGLTRETVTWLLTFPGLIDAVLAITFGFGSLIALIYVAVAAGSEWNWGTLKIAVARGESRRNYTLATFASLSLILGVGLAITFLAGIAAAVAGGLIAGLPVGALDGPALGGALAKLVRAWVALVGLTSVAYMVSMVARSQMAGVGTVIGLFIASTIVTLVPVIREIFKYLPFSASGDAIGLGSEPGARVGAASLDPNVALFVTIGWLIGLLAIAVIATERAEIKG